jgi:myo-inositol-1(or 4)-monophosphatase
MMSREYFETAYRIAGEAAAILRDLREDKRVAEKVEEGRETIVADRDSEDFIISSLRSEGFDGRIVTEERGVIEGKGEIVAVVDPLDGSRNYIHGVPWCSVSIAFVDKESESILAGVVAPVFQGLPMGFYRGGGLFLGKSRAPVFDTGSGGLPEPVYAVYGDEPDALKILTTIYEEKRRQGLTPKIRSLGSAALELAYVSLGIFTAFIDVRSKLRVVDIAAGIGMIEEAGGSYSSLDGGKPRIRYDRIERIGSIVASLKKEEVDSVIEIYNKFWKTG